MKVEELDPTGRFSERVEDYERFRPSYPADLLDYLNDRVQLSDASVADVGSGTGIFTRQLLNYGSKVYAIEPNAAMRQAAENTLGNNSKFISVDGTAENSQLERQSIDLITCAQAFHWFDVTTTRSEFSRILRPNGLIALIWNDGVTAAPVNLEYEQIKREFGKEKLEQVDAITSDLDKTIPKFFADSKFETRYFKNSQDLDLPGLIGRYFSSSYAPSINSPIRQRAVESLTRLFAKHESDGVVTLEYQTELFLGQ